MPSSRPRGRPRSEARRTDDSRRELLDAAAAEFAASGYQAATVDKVVDRAGLSKGTFYWAFESKEDLFLALLEERLDAPARRVIEVVAAAPAEIPSAPAVSAGLAALVSSDPDVIRLLHEYWAAATRDRKHARRYRRRHTALRSALSNALAARHEKTGVPLTIPADDLAEAFLALALGLGMAAVVHPGSVRADLFGDIASLIYDGMVHRAMSSGTR